MGGKVRGGDISKGSARRQAQESVIGARVELPAESRFATLSADLAARRRFEEGKRNALEWEFNRAFEQFQRLASRKPGEKLRIPGYYPITVEEFLYRNVENVVGALRVLRGLTLGELFFIVQEGTEGPDIIVSREWSSSPQSIFYFTKMKNFFLGRSALKSELKINTREVGEIWKIEGSAPQYSALINTKDPDLALKIHREFLEKCLATGSESDAWRWLIHESPYSNILSEWE